MGHHTNSTAERIALWSLFALTVLIFVVALIACACCWVQKKAFKFVAYIGTFVAGAIMLYQLTLALTAQLEGHHASAAAVSSLLATVATR